MKGLRQKNQEASPVPTYRIPNQSVVVDPVESAQQRKPKWVSVVQNDQPPCLLNNTGADGPIFFHVIPPTNRNFSTPHLSSFIFHQHHHTSPTVREF